MAFIMNKIYSEQCKRTDRVLFGFSEIFIFIFLLFSHNHIFSQGKEQNNHEFQGLFNPAYEPVIDSIIQLLSLEEKIEMIHGTGKFISPGIERLGMLDLKYTDGPTGVREEMERDTWKPLGNTNDSVTFFPTGTALAATWNKDLALKMGIAIGSETNARGKHILLGPGVNIIRTPLCGRNFEYFTEDPCLNIAISNGYIKGVQMQDVAACIKHYALNNQENNRWIIDTKVDARTLNEIYLPVYKAAVYEANVFTFMGAYNKFSGDWLCENDYLLNKILKEQWGFKGIVISDWGATHSTIKAALSGLDVEMGTHKSYNEYFFSEPLLDSVKTGLVAINVIDDKVRRVLRVMYNCKINDPARIKREANTPEICSTAYQLASESIVLLKNDNNILPLDINSIKSIAIIGENATYKHASGGFGAGVKARYEITPLQGIKNLVANRIILNIALGYKSHFVSSGKKKDYSWMRYPRDTADYSLIEEAVEAAKNSEIAIIFAGSNHGVETEAADRKNIKLPFGQDKLIAAVSKANPRTIVVLVAGSAFDLSEINKHVPAILQSWFNGSEGGHGLADILFGKVNPSGKLPFTIPIKLEDIAAHALGAYSPTDSITEYKEGILVGYRWFDTKNISPLFCFGHGLSYTAFSLSNIQTNKNQFNLNDSISISFDIQNTGKISGYETVQLYVGTDNSKVVRPSKELRAFEKIFLTSGQKKKVSLRITTSDLAYYNTEISDWTIEPTKYLLQIGISSRDIKLTKDIYIE